VAVDERDAAIAETSLEGTHEQCLGCLVLCEEEHRPVHEGIVYDLQYALDLRLRKNVLRRVEQFLERRDLVRVKVENISSFLDEPLFHLSQLVQIGGGVLGQ